MIIEFLDGRRVDLEETYRIKRLFHRIPSININHQTQNIAGRGDVVSYSSFNKRVITVQFLYDVDSIYGYYLLRDELHAIFSQTEPFYIIFKREQYKRYLVRLNSQFEIEPAPRMNSFEVEFLMERNYAESLGTSFELENTTGWDENIWGFGSGVDYDTDYFYTYYNTDTFVIKNIGNVTVDPRESDLEIRLRGVFPNGATIENMSTGDIYQYNAELLAFNLLVIDGVDTRLANQSVFNLTNRKLITLKPGDNIFRITGGTVSQVDFVFRFLYK